MVQKSYSDQAGGVRVLAYGSPPVTFTPTQTNSIIWIVASGNTCNTGDSNTGNVDAYAYLQLDGNTVATVQSTNYTSGTTGSYYERSGFCLQWAGSVSGGSHTVDVTGSPNSPENTYVIVFEFIS